MTNQGRGLGYGSSFEVSPAEVWQFLGLNMYILVFSTGGPKEDFWEGADSLKYRGAVFVGHNLGQYGISYNRFCKLMRSFVLPTGGVGDADAFKPIRHFQDEWNSTMYKALEPGGVIIMDESMGQWLGKGMPGLMHVQRKPTPIGRETHTLADKDTGCIIRTEIYEGKAYMQGKDFVSEYNAGTALTLRMTKPWWGSGRLVILDSAFASFMCAKALANKGMYMVGNVKTAHWSFPKAWLLSQVPTRGNRAVVKTTIRTDSNEEWTIIGAADRDKQPMVLIGTAGSTNEGAQLSRTFTRLRGDGTYNTYTNKHNQMHIHELYRSSFNVVDMHNAKRQGGASLEDTWKTHKWWVRDFQVFV